MHALGSYHSKLACEWTMIIQGSSSSRGRLDCFASHHMSYKLVYQLGMCSRLNSYSWWYFQIPRSICLMDVVHPCHKSYQNRLSIWYLFEQTKMKPKRIIRSSKNAIPPSEKVSIPFRKFNNFKGSVSNLHYGDNIFNSMLLIARGDQEGWTCC